MIARWRLVLALAALAALLPQPALAKVRALFVGIDSYEYAGASNGFADLHGSVNDALALRAALNRTYGFGFVAQDGSSCPATAPVAATTSVTLLNQCATRAAILGMLQGLIAVSAPGDTVLFFYAGHGAQIDDSAFNDKAAGLRDTLLTWDSRGPLDRYYQTEIADAELDVIIRNALNVQGANVITIFDSCHSGTADRDAVPHSARSAPLVHVDGLRQPIGQLQERKVATPGHRAHLAAASDDQLAAEAVSAIDGQVHGVFTAALLAVLDQTKGEALADIKTAVAQAMAANPAAKDQTPIGDGLVMTLDGASNPGVLLAATTKGGKVVLGDGVLGNVTAGSQFALYPDWTHARMPAASPLTNGHVVRVDDNSATLALDAAPATALPPTLVAREVVHAFDGTVVRVARDPALAALVDNALAPLGQVVAADRAEIVLAPAAGGQIAATTRAGTPLAMLPAANPAFAAKLADLLRPRARIDQLVALANPAGTTDLAFCASNTLWYRLPGQPCPPPAPLKAGAVAHLAVTNLASDARYVTVFGISDDNGVAALTLQDAPLPAGHVLAIDLIPDSAGMVRFLVLATDKAIDSAALEQSGGARDPGRCTSRLEQLLCNANRGTRDAAMPDVPDWAGLVVSEPVTP